MLMRAEGDCMFDVYLNEKRDRLLVVARGQPTPIIGNSGRWRKKKGAVAVSDEIKLALQRDGFYWRADGPNIEGATLSVLRTMATPRGCGLRRRRREGFSEIGLLTVCVASLRSPKAQSTVRFSSRSHGPVWPDDLTSAEYAAVPSLGAPT
jgi:hypothetical protein